MVVRQPPASPLDDCGGVDSVDVVGDLAGVFPSQRVGATRLGPPSPAGWPDVGRLLNLGRSSTYERAHDGSIPTVRLGKRFVVPTAALRRMLGLDDAGRSRARAGGSVSRRLIIHNRNTESPPDNDEGRPGKGGPVVITDGGIEGNDSGPPYDLGGWESGIITARRFSYLMDRSDAALRAEARWHRRKLAA